LGWLDFARLGLVQASIGAIVIFATSSLGRVMVVEYGLPAFIPGALVATHYAVQILRPRWGFGADIGGRQTPWIIGGMALLAAGGVAAAVAVTMLHAHVAWGLALALGAYLAIGVGVGAAGTSLLVLLTKQVRPQHRAPAATIVWMMMIVGFVATAAFAGAMLDPFSSVRLTAVSAVISAVALTLTVAAVWRIEPRATAAPVRLPARRAVGFLPALRDVLGEAPTRRFTLFVFLSMFAYSAQELILEPFAGLVFGLTPGASARLSGIQHAGLLAGMILVAVAGRLFAGRALGAMRLWIVGGCVGSALAVAGVALTGLAGAATTMRAVTFVLGMANGVFSIAAIGAMMQLASNGRDGREGTRLGVWGAAQAIAFALGGLVASGASDIARLVLGEPIRAYGLVFCGEAALFLIAALVAHAVFPRKPVTAAARPANAPSIVEYGGLKS
jgi:BCD family chlorophyll transporter-like MFS transporter